MVFGRRVLPLLCVFICIVPVLSSCCGFVLDEVVYVNPFTGDRTGLRFHGFNTSDGSMYASFTVTGFADTASGRYRRNFPVLVEVEFDEDVLDLTPAIAETIAKQMRSSAVNVKESLQSFYLWTVDDEERFHAFNDYLSMSITLSQNRNTSEAAYTMREALRLLLALEGHMIVETQIDYVQGPITILMLALFAFFLTRLLFTRLWKSFTAIIFTTLLLVFTLSHPYIRIFFSNIYNFACALAEFPKVLEKPDLLILNMILIVAPFLAVFVVLKTWRPKDHSVLDQTVRSIKARRLRFTLALTTIIIVSVASMMHSAAFISPMTTMKDLPYKSTVTYGLVAFRYTLSYLTIEDPKGFIIPIQPAEALWFLRDFGYELSLYGLRTVQVGDATSSYGEYSLATLNLTYAVKYSGFTIFPDSLLEPGSSGSWVVVSQELMRSFGTRVGDYMLVGGKSLKIIGTYSREDVIKLLDIDGYPLFTKVGNETLEASRGEDVDLITNYDVFKSLDSESGTMGDGFVKVSIVFNSSQGADFKESVRRLLTVETDIYEKYLQSTPMGGAVYHIKGFTYLLHVVEKNAVSEVLQVRRTVQVQGSWAAQAVVMTIGAGIMYVTATAIVYEKRRDFKVMSLVGAQPSFITSSLLSEGLFLGVIGGIFSYGIGYVTIWWVNLLCPNSVVALPSGLFHMILVTTVSIITATAGYLMPAREAIRLVIPSGLLRREVGEVISQDGEGIVLHTPLRAHIREKPLLEEFFLQRFPTFFPASLGDRHGLAIKGFNEKLDASGMAFLYEASYTPVSSSRQPIPVLLTIRADRDADYLILKTIVESSALRRFSKLDLKDVLLEIRGNILSYVDWKRLRTRY